VTAVLRAILAQQGLFIQCHALQERPAQCRDCQRQMLLAQVVTIVRQGHRRLHQLMMPSRQMEATGAGQATTACQALAGQSLADQAHTIHHISRQVMQRAYRAQQGHTVAQLDSQRQLISVPMDIFAQLARPALDHRLVSVLLVRHAQLEQSPLHHVLQEPISLSGARPLAYLAQPVTDAAQQPELENVERTTTARVA
jgi:hypothetical protein